MTNTAAKPAPAPRLGEVAEQRRGDGVFLGERANLGHIELVANPEVPISSSGPPPPSSQQPLRKEIPAVIAPS